MHHKTIVSQLIKILTTIKDGLQGYSYKVYSTSGTNQISILKKFKSLILWIFACERDYVCAIFLCCCDWCAAGLESGSVTEA